MKLSHTFKCFFLFFLGIFVVNAPYAYAYRFVVYGDSRAAKGESTVFNRPILGAINAKIAALHPKPDFAFFLGDCVYPGWAHNYVHNNLLDWSKFMKRGLGKIPFYTAIGNNDLYGNTGWTEFPLQTQCQSVFDYLPSNGPHNYKKLVYSLEHGQGNERTLFIVLDSFGFYTKDGALVNYDNGVDQEQLDWFAKKAKNSKARYKFVLSHGPAFSIEGWPVDPSILQVWKLMGKNHFNGFYCAHEHIFSRWDITKKVYPQAKRTMIQTIVGSAGSPLDDISLVKVNFHEAHIYRGYTFIVVDIHEHKMVQRSYALILKDGGYTTRLIDKFVRKIG
jgi:hypothetical protein